MNTFSARNKKFLLGAFFLTLVHAFSASAQVYQPNAKCVASVESTVQQTIIYDQSSVFETWDVAKINAAVAACKNTKVLNTTTAPTVQGCRYILGPNGIMMPLYTAVTCRYTQSGPRNPNPIEQCGSVTACTNICPSNCIGTQANLMNANCPTKPSFTSNNLGFNPITCTSGFRSTMIMPSPRLKSCVAYGYQKCP